MTSYSNQTKSSYKVFDETRFSVKQKKKKSHKTNTMLLLVVIKNLKCKKYNEHLRFTDKTNDTVEEPSVLLASQL